MLLEQCTTRHDLKTVLDQPRPPATWTDVVERMAEKPTLFGTITELDQARVTAYLIAITPDLQKSAKRRRADAKIPAEEPPSDAGVEDAAPSDGGVADATVPDAGVPRDAGVVDASTVQPPPIDPAQARTVFQRKCSGCHETSDIDANPPRTSPDARALVKRMVDNGLKATRRELSLIGWWLEAHYVRRAQ